MADHPLDHPPQEPRDSWRLRNGTRGRQLERRRDRRSEESMRRIHRHGERERRRFEGANIPDNPTNAPKTTSRATTTTPTKIIPNNNFYGRSPSTRSISSPPARYSAKSPTKTPTRPSPNMASRSASVGDPAAAFSSSSAPVGPSGKPSIPFLTNMVPSTFTLMPEGMFDFLASPDDEPLRDRVARLRHILDTIDYQRAGVRDNMLYMFDREKERLIQAAADQEAAAALGQAPPDDPGLDPAEVDELVAAMEAPADPRVNYRMGLAEVYQMDRDVKQQQWQKQQHQQKPPRAPTARDRAMEGLFLLVESALKELTGYDAHIMNIRRKYAERLEKEEALISEAGLRPEERVLGR